MSTRLTSKNSILPLKLLKGYLPTPEPVNLSKKRIVSINHPLVQHWSLLNTDKKYRNKNKEIVVPGLKLMKELALKTEFKHVLITSSETDLSDIKFNEQNINRVSNRIIERITGITSFEGGAAALTDLPSPIEDFGDPRLILAIDHVSDPGHLGTILRTALALQWHGVFILPNCVDPFHPVAIRASQGALFHLPFKYATISETQQFASKHKLAFVSAHQTGEAVSKTSFFAQGKAQGTCLLIRDEHVDTPAPSVKVKKLWLNELGNIPHSETLGGSEECLPLLETPTRCAIMMDLIRSIHFDSVSRTSFTTSPTFKY
eukprot:GDKJ01062823.1.p1 GENE.GDKJ01062823.1~~GDKJ01062823.1.p1  ORF type:complete len:317 (-),score=27.55 GDKJ01062823.1:117-1067(-)